MATRIIGTLRDNLVRIIPQKKSVVSLEAVRHNNSQINRLYEPNLVAVFGTICTPFNYSQNPELIDRRAVGGTSGIGESTARAFVRNAEAPHVYLIGRSEERASKLAAEFQQMKPDGQIHFIKSDVSLLREVNRVCRAIWEKEEKVNPLFLSPGIGTMTLNVTVSISISKSWCSPILSCMNILLETDEGLDRKLNLFYYSRMRFVTGLLPLLTKAAEGRGLSRVVSVLGPIGEGALNLDDLSLKTHYSPLNFNRHAVTMNSVSMEHLASSYPQTSFVHSFPGIVKTSLGRGMGPVGRYAAHALMFLLKPWEVPFDESGERQMCSNESAVSTANMEGQCCRGCCRRL